eukprot:TRINITY_DN26864_c0_g1_i1.p1 TRINITY_DN26864_c0_g1~~TRINITY_DN26864_c0_g1_i1.p1  ORF type:complete len:600 (+),score=213.87 TRINITY_DN26864_c0_g1_i1:106-1800(+)
MPPSVLRVAAALAARGELRACSSCCSRRQHRRGAGPAVRPRAAAPQWTGRRRASAPAAASAAAALRSLEPPERPVDIERAAELLVPSPWSREPFDQGAESNAARIASFESQFLAGFSPSSDQGERAAAALDLVGACIKVHRLDRADELLARVTPWCRAAGGPFLWKVLQRGAMLRFRQHRLSECVHLLEELADAAPPNPATYSNLATAHCTMGDFQRAQACLEKAVQLKGGVRGKDEKWTQGTIKKGTGDAAGAVRLLEEALQAHLQDCPGDTVLLGKVRESLGEALLAAEQPARAVEQFRSAVQLFSDAQGEQSPLAAGAFQKLAQGLAQQGDPEGARGAAVAALRGTVRSEGVHPTPTYELLEHILELHTQQLPEGSTQRLVELHGDCRALVQALEQRGLLGDGDGGVVLHKVAEVLLFAGPQYAPEALRLLERAEQLVGAERGEDLEGLLDVIRMEIGVARQALADDDPDSAPLASPAPTQPELVSFPASAQPRQAAAAPAAAAWTQPQPPRSAGNADSAHVAALSAEVERLQEENERLRVRIREVAAAWSVLQEVCTEEI